jgi:hypothetical protein
VSDDRAELADIFLDTVPDLPADVAAQTFSRTFAAAPDPYTSSLVPSAVTDIDHTDLAGDWTFHPVDPVVEHDPDHPDEPGDEHGWDLDGDW